jgi:hydrogenase maturation protein HypF
VQGVGFRPFVHALAHRLRLAGHVGNDATGVFIEVEGAGAQVEEFLQSLRRDAPPLAHVERVDSAPALPRGEAGFAIVPSQPGGPHATLVSADTAPCRDCLAELTDPTDRRYRYPFINCTNCGPRFTIVRDIPYDRPLTTMAPFPMCPACAVEYHDPADRRFHAQPVCCPSCGPRLRFIGPTVDTDPLAAAVAALGGGSIVAVKGIGGYHLAVRAVDPVATRALRERKHREDKPFAVMVADLRQAATLCRVEPEAAELLTSRARPIVLLPRHPDAPVAGAVAPGTGQLGLMLPNSPLHHLLLAGVGEPIVLTSGNVSDEPIAYDDADALDRLAPIADAFLLHDRAINVRADDSVARIVTAAGVPGSAPAGRSMLRRSMVVRRARGYAPEPVRLAWPAPRPILACGAEVKSTFCLTTGPRAFVSPHIGDLTNYPTLRSYQDGIAHLQRLFSVTPQVVAHDLHPEYLSTKHALELSDVELVGVQHHHAHIASCLADNGHSGRVIGVAFDGTGYGPDATIWGGELLVADLLGYTRVGHLVGVAMPGGAAAIRQPWRMAVAQLDAAFGSSLPDGLGVLDRNPTWERVRALARSGVNAPVTSSAGRLFDAVAALLGVRDEVTYEGQAAIELEQLADPGERGSYHLAIGDGEVLALAGADLIRAVVADLSAGVAAAAIAARFHRGLAEAVVRACGRLRSRSGLSTVALSGGVFQNMLLLDLVATGLASTGFEVLTHHRVPPNDGGISLGQAAVAAALDRASRTQ